jgi:hypothetical protein
MQCPHCLQNFHDSWAFTLIRKDDTRDNLYWAAGSTVCPACKQPVIRVGLSGAIIANNGAVVLRADHTNPAFRLVYPKAVSRSPVPPEVPKEFVTDYSEACVVLPDSEKASAALSRRCLQHLLREKAGIKKGNLSIEIQQVLDSKQLPSHLGDDLDAIRNIGNFAAHPLKAMNTGEIVDVEPQEAEWLLTVLEQLFDFYFVQPTRAKARRDALNAKLQGVGKPPMKGT